MAMEWQLQERIGTLRDALRPDCSLCSLRCAPGKGSFGAVYRGVHVHTGEEVAVKIINLEDACAPSGFFALAPRALTLTHLPPARTRYTKYKRRLPSSHSVARRT